MLKEDEFEDDKDKLVEFYQNKGYIDFAIQDIKYDYIDPEVDGHPHHRFRGAAIQGGTLDIKGNTIFTTNDFIKGVKMIDGKLMVLTN